MGLIDQCGHGPDFRQVVKPSDHSTGRLWYKMAQDEYSMADGVDYWDRTVNPNAKGYFAGGAIVGESNATSSIETLNFLTEFTASLATNLALPRFSVGYCNTSDTGYATGGQYTTVGVRDYQKLAFISETSSTLSTTLTDNDTELVGHSNYSTMAYFSGGRLDDAAHPGNFWSLIFRFNIIAETSAKLVTTMTETKSAMSCYYSLANNAGYTLCGYKGVVSGSYTMTSRAEKFAYSTETVATLYDLASLLRMGGGFFQTAYVGYLCSGRLPSGTGVVVTSTALDKLTFATDTMSTVTSVLTGRHNSRGVASNTYGYYAGGLTTGFAVLTSIEKLTFLLDSVSYNISSLNQQRQAASAFSRLAV